MPRKSTAAHVARKKQPRRFGAWSLSRYLEYAGPSGCPRKAARRFIDKADTTPASPAMARGGEVHAAGAEWLAKKRRNLPPEYTAFRTEMKQLRSSLVAHEQQWAFTEDWDETEWFSNDTWVRIVADALAKTAKDEYHIVDFKTGKYHGSKIEEYRLQLELYAIAVFRRYPDARRVVAEIWYLDAGVIHGGEEDGFVFERENLELMTKVWSERVRPMLRDRRFPARPSADACRFCFDASARGGSCRY